LITKRSIKTGLIASAHLDVRAQRILPRSVELHRKTAKICPSIQNIKERATCHAEIIHETNNTTHLIHRELSAFAHHNKNNASQNVTQQFSVTKSVDATKPTTAHMHVDHAALGMSAVHSTLERSANEQPHTLHRARHH
jgi:hypothetical protein